MTTIYNADTWCDDCGRAIAAELAKPDYPEPWDSDDYPSIGHSAEECDGPQHCASQAECKNAIDLTQYGDIPELFGAESRKIGDFVDDGLTEYGVDYLREMLAESPITPYQAALHTLWREAYADYL